MKLTDGVYNAIKQFAQLHLPAAGALYFALAAIWHWPHVQDVVGSITALDAFLGIGLTVSSSAYKPASDGQLVIDKSNPAKDVYSLELTTPVHEIDGKNAITLNVVPKTGG